MSQTTESPRGAGPGTGYVPRWAIVVSSVVSIVLAVFILYSLWAFWPVSGAGQITSRPQSMKWFGISLTLDRDFLFFIVVALAGGLGGLIHTIRSFTWYVGNRDLRWSWMPFNLLLPVVGALGGTVFYLVLRAGLFSPSTSVEQASPFGFAAVSVLVGLFSEQALEKLRQIASNLFSERPQGTDHVEPQ